MKLRRAVKKICALGMGATMLGATLLGASAADLSQYPGMFIDDGQFDGILVIGKQADAIDTIGITNIAMGLQAAAVTQTTVCSEGTATTTSISDGVKVEKSSTDLEMWHAIGEVLPTTDNADLPSVLADGNYAENEGDNKNDVDYTQVINFPALDVGLGGSGYLYSTQDEDGAPDAGPYLYFAKGVDAYEYVLEFDSPVQYEASGDGPDDLESTTIEMQGRTYTITDVELDGSDEQVNKLTLFVGDTLMWMTQDQEIVKTLDGVDHTIRMVDVTSDADACGFEIDGTTVWIDVESTDTVGGVSIGVTDAKAVHTEKYDADICQVNLGAAELVLEEGQEVSIDGTEIDGSDVTFDISGSPTPGEWEGLKITWAPDDETYLAPGEELIDPVFGNFKIVYAADVRTQDTLSHTTSGEDGEISFVSSDGKDIVIPLYASDDNSGVAGLDSVGIGEGDDVDEIYYYNSAALTKTTCETADVTDCEGATWIVESNGETHMLVLKNIDIDDQTIDFEDDTYGVVDSDNNLADVAYGLNTVYIGGLGDIGVRVNTTTITLSSIGSVDNIETEYGATLTLAEGDHTADATHTLTVSWTEEETNFQHDTLGTLSYLLNLAAAYTPVSDTQDMAATISFAFSVNDDEEIEVGVPSATTKFAPYAAAIASFTGAPFNLSASQVTSLLAFTVGFMNGGASKDFSVDNDDIQVRSTWRGTGVGHNVEDDNLLMILYADEKVTGDVYIAPVSAQISTSSGAGEGCQVYETLNKIPATVNKFDSDVANPNAQNLITVGGPCANSVTKALLGNPAVCYDGFSAGKALIKLVESNGKVAVLVAGGTGEDTLAASNVLADYEKYAGKLKGSELTVNTANPNAVSFTAGWAAAPSAAPAAAEPEPAAVPPAPTLNCAGSSSETGGWDTVTSKLGISKEKTTDLEVSMDGLSGTLTFHAPAFEPEYGVDWYQFVVHILDENNAQVTALTYKWEEGDADKSQSFTVPAAGCYKLKVAESDMSVDGATIKMANGADYVLDFSTA